MTQAASVHTKLGGSGGTEFMSNLEEVTVLVTGYGPFLDQFPINSSWSVASALPSHLPATPTYPTPVRIIVPNHYIKTAYRPVIAAVPTLLSDDYASPPPSIILHLGMAAGRSFYTLETTSYRYGYENMRDVEGMTFPEADNKKLFGDSPAILQSGWDFEDLWRRWRGCVSPELDVRTSNNPGNFLCGFIYYTSSDYLWRSTQKREGTNLGTEAGGKPASATQAKGSGEMLCPHKTKHVMFLHVPDIIKMGHVANGVEAATGLIRALVESRRRGRCGDVLNASEDPVTKEPRNLERMW